MIKEFNNKKEIRKYFDKITNTYIFKEKGEYIDLVVFNFCLDIKADIDCWNIYAMNIKAWGIRANNISAWNIDARNINALDIKALSIIANDISYWAVCYACNKIKCRHIKGRRHNAKHFVLDDTLEVAEDE